MVDRIRPSRPSKALSRLAIWPSFSPAADAQPHPDRPRGKTWRRPNETPCGPMKDLPMLAPCGLPHPCVASTTSFMLRRRHLCGSSLHDDRAPAVAAAGHLHNLPGARSLGFYGRYLQDGLSGCGRAIPARSAACRRVPAPPNCCRTIPPDWPARSICPFRLFLWSCRPTRRRRTGALPKPSIVSCAPLPACRPSCADRAQQLQPPRPDGPRLSLPRRCRGNPAAPCR